MKPSSPFIIPVFIAHLGCPHRCVFCNQHSITGKGEVSGPEMVTGIIDAWLARKPLDDRRLTQVAFYGGSFTALPAARQASLLAAVEPYLERGLVQEIRLSTRPDAIDQPRIDFLKQYGVRVVELGAQSMDDHVLALSGRGHSFRDTEEASVLLKQNGLTLGIQLMLGLPGESPGKLLAGARRVCRLRPDFVRLYPTLVIRGTKLAGMYEAGLYRPLSLGRAVLFAGRMKEIFAGQGIPVVRIGLQHEEALVDGLIAGPYHPAFGELVLSRIFYRKVRSCLAQMQGDGKKVLSVSSRDQSIFRGPGNCNLKRLEGRGLLQNVALRFDPGLSRDSVIITSII